MEEWSRPAQRERVRLENGMELRLLSALEILQARREAEEELRQKRSMAEYQLAQGNLARALNRLRISGRM